MNVNLNSFRPRGQKMRAEIDQDNSMAKSPPRTRFLLIRTSEHTGIFSCGKKARNYAPAGQNCQKRWPLFSEPRVRDQDSHPGCRAFMSFTPFLRPWRPAGTLSHGVS